MHVQDELEICDKPRLVAIQNGTQRFVKYWTILYFNGWLATLIAHAKTQPN